MKICTLLKFDESGDRIAEMSISVVEDDHVFGWVDGELHMEGSISVVDHREQLEPGDKLWSVNEKHET